VSARAEGPARPATESDAKKASRDAGIYTYSRLAGSLFVLLALALGARLYSTAEFAYVSAVLLLYESAVTLGSLGLSDSVFFLIGKDPGKASHVVRQTSLLLLAVALPVIGVVWAIGAGMSTGSGAGSTGVAQALPWLAAAIVIELPTQPAINQLLAVGKARLASGLYVSFAALRPVAVVVPPLLALDVSWVPIIMALGGAVRLLVFTSIVRSVFPITSSDETRWFSWRPMRAILLFALPAGVAALGGQLNPQIDKYVVQMVRGNEDFVLYTAGAWELPLVTLVPYAIGAVMQARYVRLFVDGKHAELRGLWIQTVRKTAIIVLPLSMMLIALAEQAVSVVAGEKYVAAAPLFQIFTLVLLMRVASYGSMLQSIGETRSLLVTSVLLLVTNLALSYPFTIAFGFPGAAIATVCASVPPLLFTLWRISVGMQTSIRHVMPWGFYAGTLIVSAAVAAGVWALARLVGWPAGPTLAAGAAVYLVAYFVIARVLRLIGDEDVKYLRDWLTLRMLRRERS
jgi:O-antigen/teichoic acid export membrane protein